MTTKQIKELLIRAGVNFDTLGKNRAGNYVIRTGYFYHHGRDNSKYAAEVAAVPGLEVVNSGDHWAAFRGGASVASSSHLWVEFKLKQEVAVAV